MNPLDLIDRATLSGFPLMLAMLLCFLTGALPYLRIVRHARRLWERIAAQRPTATRAPTRTNAEIVQEEVERGDSGLR